jgi:hypothetical protein
MPLYGLVRCSFLQGGVHAGPLWPGRLSDGKRGQRTLEISEAGWGFGIRSNWPGLALVSVGAVLLLAVVAF